MNEENEGEIVKEQVKQVAKKNKENKSGRYIWVSMLILAAVIIGLLFYKQKILTDVPREVKVTEDFTANWKTFESTKYGFSFKIPQEWLVTEKSDYYQIFDEKKSAVNLINIRVNDRRSLDSKEESDQIQISIPFDKRNYLIFSTSTSNEQKKVFYNIASTLEIGK